MLRKSSYLTIWYLLYSLNCLATHNRAGEISYQLVSYLTYQATIITYTKTSSQSADRDSLELDWGDGTHEKIVRSNGIGLPPQGIDLGYDIKMNFYQSGLHTYPEPCEYVISVTDPNRTGNIINIVAGSVNVKFYVESLILIKDPSFCTDQSVFFGSKPVFFGNVNQNYTHNVAAVNPDGDSLSFELIVPLQDKNFSVPNYQSPEVITPGAQQSFTLNPRTGEIVWETPKTPGIYSVAVKVNEWKNGFYSGFVMRDFQIIVMDIAAPVIGFDSLQSWPVDASGSYFVSVNPGDTIDLSFFTVHADSVYSIGQIFNSTIPAMFNHDVISGKGSFFWVPDSTSAREQPYITVFRASMDTGGILLEKDLTLLVHVKGGSVASCQERQSCISSAGNIAYANSFYVQPNPFHDRAVIIVPEGFSGRSLELEVYDISGRLMNKQILIDRHFEINRLRMQDGLYFYSIREEGVIVSSGRVVVN